MARAKEKQTELTGRHVLIILLVFFGVMLAVNAYFTFVAVKSFRGEDVKGSYRQGLEYNQTIAARGEQKELGWSARVNTQSAADGGLEIIVMISDAADLPVGNLAMTGTLRHPVDLSNDIALKFEDTGGGRFTARADNVTGRWALRGEARQDGQIFKFEQDIWVK